MSFTITSFSEGRHRPAVKQEEAAAMLTELLGEKGWCSYDDVKRFSDEEGVNLNTLKKAKKVLKLQTLKYGFGTGSLSYWFGSEIKTEDMKQIIKESLESQTDSLP